MNTIIPESGKLSDLDLGDVRTMDDAELVAEWLSDIISEMRDQMLAHFMGGKSGHNERWLQSVRTALKSAVKTKYRVRQMQRIMRSKGLSRADMFIEQARGFLSEEDVKSIWNTVDGATGKGDGDGKET